METRSPPRNRGRKITWFNPPFAENVSTNIGKKCLRLIETCFPPGHPLHQIFNINSVKISYKCTPNLAKSIAAHNANILNTKKEQTKNCNCRNKESCPVEGDCLAKNVIYQATVKHDDQVETYIGLTATTFKSRWEGHKTSFKHQKHQNSTTLSQYIWKLKNEQKTFTLTWKFVSRAPPFSPVSGTCQLCTREKYFIIFKPHLATLNSRNELASCCRHKQAALLRKS